MSKTGSRESISSSLQKLIIFKKNGLGVEVESNQPSLVAVGPNRKAISQYLVIIDQKQSLVTTSANAIEAVDFIFAVYYVFNFKYEPCLNNFFKFLQTKIYKLSNDKTTNSINKIAVKLLIE